ncbi:NAD(P)-dependent oxidoreductase [Occultella kanbiaonis]|uniref:NAD(P)-dependent oxidoreductase n=1 Tax=Occultella kanbiaonis TaxID=2675754 RepID=UPI0013D4C733|nr:NAD(P)-dependent oxidoreductase [Occultella kanbiaonis]
MNIGVIGLGTMGAPMAGHLLSARREDGRLLVTARRPGSAAELLQAGADWAPTPAALAAECAVIVTVLPDLPELRDVLEGPDGLLAGRTGDLLLVVCSTSSPDGVRTLAGDLTERTGGALRVVDAPVSGGRECAVAATLSILVGGAEAAVIAERSGLDLAALFDVLGGGYAGSRLLDVKGPRFVAHDHEPASAARLMIKDLDFAQAQGRLTGGPTEHAQFLQQVFAGVVAAGLGDLDSSVVQRYLEERSAS